jgi:hypothetical protein
VAVSSVLSGKVVRTVAKPSSTGETKNEAYIKLINFPEGLCTFREFFFASRSTG